MNVTKAFLVFTLFALASGSGARASLGERAPALKESRPFGVRETKVAGTSVREFVAPNGEIFGVTWVGHRHPNFRALLGSYADEYDQALRASRKGRAAHSGQRSREVRSAHLVVQIAGHFRKMEGRAYVPGLLPEGVTANDIH